MTLPADSTEIEKAWAALNYKNLDGLDDFDFFAAGYTAARASTIEECARVCDDFAAGAKTPLGQAKARAVDECAARIRDLARADPADRVG